MRTAIGMAIAISISWNTAAFAAEPLTKLEARASSEAALKRRVFGLLGDVLHEYERPSRGQLPRAALRRLHYWTTPRPGEEPGVCLFDSVIFAFEPSSAEATSKTPARLVGVDADTRFRMIATPAGASASWPNDAAVAACNRLNPENDDFFDANDEEDAVLGWRTTAMALAQAKSNPKAIQVTCDVFPHDEPHDCLAVLASLDIKNLMDVLAINRAPNYSLTGVKVWFPDYELNIELTEGPSPRVKAVRMEELVTIADSLID